MRITPAAKALSVCIVLLMAVSSCSLLEKQVSGTASRPGGIAAAPGGDASLSPDTLKAFPLFKSSASGMQRQNCSFDFTSTSDREQETKKYIQDEIACLGQAWQQPLSSAGLTPSPQSPAVQFTDQSTYSTQCQDNVTTTSSICRQGLTFQVSNDSYYLSDNSTNAPWTFVEVANEYSFWLLDAVGIRDTVDKLMEQAGSDTPQAQEIFHRYTLSGYCFSGIYLGVQYGSNPKEQSFFQYVYNNTDNVIVDTSKPPLFNESSPIGFNRLAWFKKGADAKTTSACNTWTAPASEVL